MFEFLCYNSIDSYMKKPPKEGHVSFIRILNACRNLRHADIYTNGHILVRGIGSKKFTPYFAIPSGRCEIRACPSGKPSEIAAHTTTEFMPDSIYTCALSGASPLELVIINEPRPESVPGNANIRLVNLSQETPGFDILKPDGTAILKAVAYKGITPYTSISQGKYMLKAADVENGKTLFVIPQADIKPQWNYTIYAFEAFGKPKIHTLMLIDGNTYIQKP